MPLVSCLMPTYNRAEWIPLAIKCFLNQTFPDAELVILDNGTDNTADIVPAHPRIRYMRQPGLRLTTGEMRNLTCELAQGDIFIHWDDDDWSAPTRIESQLKDLETSGRPFVGYHRISYWHPATRLAYQYHGTRPYACGTSQCYLQSYWQQNKFDESKRVGEDSDFSRIARGQGSLDSFDGTQMIVARAHGRIQHILSWRHSFWSLPSATRLTCSPAVMARKQLANLNSATSITMEECRTSPARQLR